MEEKEAGGHKKENDERKEKSAIEKFLDKKITRREFLKYGALGIAGLALGAYGLKRLVLEKNKAGVFRGAAPDELWKWSKEAYHYKKFGGNVQCNVCPNMCLLEPGDRSVCRSRVNFRGKLYSLAYGNPCSVHVDPIEKKPLFHFLPSTNAFSIAAAGCNFRCLNCQNWNISQMMPEETTNFEIMPEGVVAGAEEHGCKSIAYTYSEPTTFYEYMYDTSKLARKKGIKNLWITNGYINEEALRDLCKYTDAANIDLKSFDEEISNELYGGSFKPVLETLKTAKEEGVWVEITNLVVPSWTDDISMIKEMCKWLYKNGFADNPLHFSRFHPQYKLTHLPQTPVDFLNSARKIAIEEGLKFVYIGNVPETDAVDTYCPKCGKIVVGRKGYTITENNLRNGSCRFCGERIAGVWEI